MTRLRYGGHLLGRRNGNAVEHYRTTAAPPPNASPVASFTTSMSDMTVTATSTSTDADGTIASHAWDFGDGATATGTPAVHTYATAGNHTITLTVTDDKGATSTKARTVTAQTDVYDDFTAATADPAKWPTINVPASQQHLAGRLRMNYSGAADARKGTYRQTGLGAVDLAQQPVTVNWAGVSGGGTSNVSSGFLLTEDTASDNYVGWDITAAGTPRAIARITGANSETVGQAAHKHLRIRVGATADEVVWEGSADGVTWTAVRTTTFTTAQLNRVDMNLRLFAGYWGTNGAGTNENHYVEFETVLVEPLPAPPVYDPLPALFSAMWTTPLAADAPVEDRAAYNGTDDFTEGRGGVPYADRLAQLALIPPSDQTAQPITGLYGDGYNTTISSGAAPLYIVAAADSATHPRQRVWFINDDGTEMFAGTDNNLPQKFLNVPVPCGPAGERFETYYGRNLEASGGDKQFVIYDEGTGELWEFHDFRGWSATFGGYTCRWGGYTPAAEGAPPAFPFTWGARATSLPLHPANISRVDWERGVIPHAIGLGIQVVKPGWIAPATREDTALHDGTPLSQVWNIAVNDGGSEGRVAVPEGAWFRLPASHVVNETAFPGNTAKSRLYAMLCRAARDYGIVITDGTGGTTTFSIEATNALGTPYSPLEASTLPTTEVGLLWGPGNILQTFPWDDLVQVKYPPA